MKRKTGNVIHFSMISVLIVALMGLAIRGSDVSPSSKERIEEWIDGLDLD